MLDNCTINTGASRLQNDQINDIIGMNFGQNGITIQDGNEILGVPNTMIQT